MNNLIADGALHEHEVKLLFLVLHCVLFACLSTDEAHCCVGQDGLQKKIQRQEDQAAVTYQYHLLELFNLVTICDSQTS